MTPTRGHLGIFGTYRRIGQSLYWIGMKKMVTDFVYFIVILPKSKGYDAILVVIDRLSKYGHFIPIKHPYSVRSIVEIFIKEVVKLHGILASVVSDRDHTFLSLFWKELFWLQGTTLNTILLNIGHGANMAETSSRFLANCHNKAMAVALCMASVGGRALVVKISDKIKKMEKRREKAAGEEKRESSRREERKQCGVCWLEEEDAMT